MILEWLGLIPSRKREDLKDIADAEAARADLKKNGGVAWDEFAGELKFPAPVLTPPEKRSPMSNLHFSSRTDDWATPQAFFDEWNRKYNFVVDVCATNENAKCAVFFTKEQDGLKQDWLAASTSDYGHTGTCWMNPPYGREIGRWVKKAHEEAGRGAVVVSLLPARTDTKWFHDFIAAPGHNFRFLRGRLKFGNAKNSAPFPSMVVVFKKP